MNMKFINEVVNGGVTIILFGVTNAVCVPIRTLEWKWKRDGSSFGKGKIFGTKGVVSS